MCPKLKNMGHFLGKMGVKYAALLNVGKNVCSMLIMLCINIFRPLTHPSGHFIPESVPPVGGGGASLWENLENVKENPRESVIDSPRDRHAIRAESHCETL